MRVVNETARGHTLLPSALAIWRRHRSLRRRYWSSLPPGPTTTVAGVLLRAVLPCVACVMARL
jgi:hypothetical protein